MLTKKQKTLPPQLQEKILASKKKKNGKKKPNGKKKLTKKQRLNPGKLKKDDPRYKALKKKGMVK